MGRLGEAFCAGVGVTLKGENFEASGPLDPTFWLIHPTMDRLFQVVEWARGAETSLNQAEWAHGASKGS